MTPPGGLIVSGAQFVRPARPSDVDTVVDVQVASWREVYGGLLPGEVIAEIGGEEARRGFHAQWSAALESPPTSRHRLVVATDENDGVRTVVGFAAFGPAGDPDLWPATAAEIFALHVDPALTRRGHGGRLLNATVDHLVEDGFVIAYVWVPEADNALRAFFESSGWAPDGARRVIDLGSELPMVRLHAGIG